MLKVQVIIGSTRSGRNADPVCNWLLPIAKAQPNVEIEVLDLREWPLPMFQETVATVGDFANPTYSDPIVKRWNNKLKEADAFVMVTPEYNRSIPGVLKNAIDSVFFSFAFRHKPVGFVGYSLGAAGGARALEHLTQIMVETEAVPVRAPAIVPLVNTAFDAQGKAVNPVLDVGLTVMLEDLVWLGRALKTARVAGQLQPSAFRLRAAAGRK